MITLIKNIYQKLTVKKIHDIFFLEEYRINVPYKLYWKIFYTFSIAFGYPRSDTCSTCDQLRVKLASDKLTPNDRQRLDTLKELHHRKANAFVGLKKAKQKMDWPQ